jgi:asparagine synthase (glutamine-hydrolysing)
MCGFAGEFVFDGRAELDKARRMAESLTHRGPDEAGAAVSPDGRCAIGFRRLRVIDPAGSQQPMQRDDGRLILACNGEIYNYRDLRRQLRSEGQAFATEGDIEVLLHWLATRGPEACDAVIGMWAYALYDAHAGRLTLGRDRLGQKPLWYACDKRRVLFASEAKALLAGMSATPPIDGDSITSYLVMGYVPGPATPWQGVRKCPPATVLTFTHPVAEAVRYWSIPDEPAEEPADQAQLSQRLTEAVGLRMVADVPLGVLLSGGIDSAVTALLMTRQAGQAGGVRSFAAGFAQAAYDERPLARATAERIGTDHTELLIEPPDAQTVGRIVDHYDEPFADSSAIPTWLICQAAREHVTVALAGDGGDEAFGGYDRYRAMHWSATMGPAVYTLLRFAGRILSPLAPRAERSRLRRLVRFADSLPYPPSTQYFALRALFEQADLGRLFCEDWAANHDPQAVVEWFCELYEGQPGLDECQAAQMHDVSTYLPDDLLIKADMASMASGLELRSPFLDHRVMEVGLWLPPEAKLGRRRGKLRLRNLFADSLPPEVVQARKRGFGVPLADWLRGPLRTMVEEAILDRGFLQAGIVRPEAVVGLWNDHISRRQDYHHRIWAMFVLARWLARQG